MNSTVNSPNSAPDSNDLEQGRDFLAWISKGSIESFTGAVMTTPTLMDGLSQIDFSPNATDAIAAFANAHGFHFTGAELSDYLDRKIENDLSERDLRHRRELLERRDRGDIPAPVPMDRDCAAGGQVLDYEDGFTLDRRGILKGESIAVRQVPAIGELVAVIREVLVRAFYPHAPREAHGKLDLETHTRIIHETYAAFLEDERIHPIMTTLMEQMGMDPARMIYEWPGFRLVFPEGSSAPGFYRTTVSGFLPAHRDTWYGSPQHQINLWGPVWPIAADATLQVFPRYYLKSIENATLGYDIWRQYVGLGLAPAIRETVNRDRVVAPPLEVGDMFCFAAHHLHASAVHSGDTTRISFELRLLHRDDEGADYVPPNIDYYGCGEIYKGWYGPDGKEIP